MNYSIIMKIMGGLGNQMFQYAAGSTLAYKFGIDVQLDISWFNNITNHDTKREFQLNSFPNIAIHYADHDEIKKIFPPRRLSIKHFLCRLQRKYVKEPSYAVWKKFFSFSPPIYLSGYWQHEEYFLNRTAEIRRSFSFPQLPSDTGGRYAQMIAQSNESVSLHIRRGDYANNPSTLKMHGLCSLQYYTQAMAANFGEDSPHFFIISDDIDWAKEHIPTERHKVTFVHVPEAVVEPWHEMHLMSLCKHHIIANSSFSWWGAWLGEREDSVIIAPKRWFQDKRWQGQTPVPDRWVTI